MANINDVVPHIIKWEGGYVNDKDDSGGATMKGVTIGTFRQFFGQDKTIEDLKNITDEQWGIIFKKGYWDKIGGDNIESQSVANLLADFAYNSGYSRANKYIQRIVSVEDDGYTGPNTIRAINNHDPEEVFDVLWIARKTFYEQIVENNPTQEKFLNGWLNRLNDFKFEG